jgi:hypothetical protein
MKDFKEIEEDDIKWKWAKHISFSNGKGNMMYRDDALGLQCEATNGKVYYFIDNDDREFLSIEQLVTAYNEKQRSQDRYVCVPANARVIVITDQGEQEL